MERIHSINPERISWCCADFGLTPEQLAFSTAARTWRSSCSSTSARMALFDRMFERIAVAPEEQVDLFQLWARPVGLQEAVCEG